MGHRSWLYKLKSSEDLDRVKDFIEQADAICGHSTSTYLEVFFKLPENCAWVGFSSNGSSVGNAFVEQFSPDLGSFGLLGDGFGKYKKGFYITPELLIREKCYINEQEARNIANKGAP